MNTIQSYNKICSLLEILECELESRENYGEKCTCKNPSWKKVSGPCTADETLCLSCGGFKVNVNMKGEQE